MTPPWAAEFARSLEPQLRAALTELVADVPAADVLGVGVYTDADAQTLVPVANTRAGWEEKSQRDPDDAAYFHYSPGEWDLNWITAVERGVPDHLATAQSELDRVTADLDNDQQLHRHRTAVFETVPRLLADMVADEFATWLNAV